MFINIDALKNTTWIMNTDTGHMIATEDTRQKLRNSGFPSYSMLSTFRSININSDMVFGYGEDMADFIKAFNLTVDYTTLKANLDRETAILKSIIAAQVR